MKVLVMSILFCLAFNASAGCPVKRPGEVPVLPDGAVASDEEMYRAQLAAEAYVVQAQSYMDCGVMNRRQHLALVGKVEQLSQAYSEEVVEFRTRSNIIAKK